MFINLKILIPILASLISLATSFLVVVRKKQSHLSKVILLSTPGIVLLQIGTGLYLSDLVPEYRFWGAKLVLIALCILIPVSTQLTILLGDLHRQAFHRWVKPTLVCQWIVSCGMALLIPFEPFLAIVEKSTSYVIFFVPYWGHAFLIYLIVSSLLILAIVENRLKVFRQDREYQASIVVYLATFVFLIITASQGLLIHTINGSLLLLISLSIILGYIFFSFTRFKAFVAAERLTIRREAVYSSFVVLLVGAYLILIGLVGKLLLFIGGDVQLFFTVISASVMCFLFFMILTSFSLRTRMREFINKTLYKNKYDYRTVWHQFGEKIAFSFDLDELNQAILSSVSEIIQTKIGAIFLVTNNRSYLVLVKKKT